MPRNILKLIQNFLIIITAALFISDLSLAQFFFFGRNKVHYEEFDWKVLRTEHFDIYYYDEMGNIAKIGAKYAEEAYDELKIKMNHLVIRRVPLIFYNTTNDFQQTNTTPGLVPEGVGGFFEFVKGRVVLPSNGSLHDFRHVIRHELTHVFMTNKIYRVLKDHRLPANRMPPLWFVEGIAEFMSTDWDAQAEMVMRDAVLNRYFVGLEDMYMIYGSFLMYKEGQNFLEFAAQKYGREKIPQLLENFWMYSSFDDVMEFTFKSSIEEIDAEWQYYLKKKYFPLMGSKYPTEFGSQEITERGFNFTPVYYEVDKRKFLYFAANRDGYSSLYRVELNEEYKNLDDPELVLRGEQTDEFEAFHLFQSSIDVSNDGLLAFVTKKGGSDVIHFFSIKENKVVKTYRNDELVFISSPKFSSNGNQIVFNAVDKKGFSDIFIFNLLDDRIYRITNDYYDDKYPVFGLSDQQIIFSSDRTGGKYEKKYNLFSCNLNTNEIKYVTYLNANNSAPTISPDKKKLLFTSEYDGVQNLYELNVADGQFQERAEKISNFISSAFNPVYVDTNHIAFAGFENFSINLFILDKSKNKNDSTYFVDTEIDSARGIWKAEAYEMIVFKEELKYEKEYSLDFAQSVVATDPVFGTRGGAIVSLSDLLGDDRYDIMIFNNATVQSEFLKSFNVLLQKVYFGGRVNYGYGIFHLSGNYYDYTDPDEYYYERSFGGSFLMSYPISKFQRLETTATIRNSDKEVIPGVIERKALLYTNTLGWVLDNSLWGPTGPVDGTRALILLGYTSDIKYSNVNYFTLIGDYRYYQRFGLLTTLAFRAAAFYNEGKEARRFFIGGSWDLRGWPRFGIRGEKIWLSSLEFRFPLIDEIDIRFPFLRLGFFGIRGALYFDAGSAWDDEYTTTLGSIGYGFRINMFGVITLRYDIGKRIINDFSALQDGFFYQFFFGWDF